MEMIFKNKLAQFSIIELPVAFIIFSISFVYFINSNLDYNLEIDSDLNSMLDSLLVDGEFVNLVLSENMSNLSLDGDWSSYNLTLSKVYSNFDLEIFDGINNKKIFFCSGNYEKLIVSNFVTIYNNTLYDFREVRLGVCR